MAGICWEKFRFVSFNNTPCCKSLGSSGWERAAYTFYHLSCVNFTSVTTTPLNPNKTLSLPNNSLTNPESLPPPSPGLLPIRNKHGDPFFLALPTTARTFNTMKVVRLIFMIAISMALTISLITIKKGTDHAQKETLLMDNIPGSVPAEKMKLAMPYKRVSRFLAANGNPKNPRKSDQCSKDNDVCIQAMPLEGRNSTCCNKKCVDLQYSSYNCGGCNKKCLPFEACCRGECVNLSYDKRHCGVCNHRCMPRGYCIYAICDYAWRDDEYIIHWLKALSNLCSYLVIITD